LAETGNKFGGTPAITELDPAVPELVKRAQVGDHQAFERLYRVHAGMVYAICLRISADRTQAEWLTQDAFVRAWQKLGSYRREGAFGAWLRRLTMNLVIEDRRRLAREAKWVDAEAEVSGSEAPAAVEDALDLERAIGTLPPGARQAFVLHDVYGYRHREIAELTGLATGTVKAHLHRARTLLRSALRGSWREESHDPR